MIAMLRYLTACQRDSAAEDGNMVPYGARTTWAPISSPDMSNGYATIRQADANNNSDDLQRN